MLTFWNRFDVCILRPRTGRPLILDIIKCLAFWNGLDVCFLRSRMGRSLFHASARFHVSCYRGLLASASKTLLGFGAPSIAIARPPRKDRRRRANLRESFGVETKRRGKKVRRVSERASERDWEIFPRHSYLTETICCRFVSGFEKRRWGDAVPVILRQGDGEVPVRGVEEAITVVWTYLPVFWFAISLVTAGRSRKQEDEEQTHLLLARLLHIAIPFLSWIRFFLVAAAWLSQKIVPYYVPLTWLVVILSAWFCGDQGLIHSIFFCSWVYGMTFLCKCTYVLDDD